MKLEDIEYDYDLKITDFENFFKIYDSNNLYRFNLNNTIYINIDLSLFLEYELRTPSQWTLISYQLYGTTRLAWLLMKINNVKLNETFKTYLPGTKIKYLSDDNVKIILNALD